MEYKGKYFIKNNEILEIMEQEESYNVDPTIYDEAYIIKKTKFLLILRKIKK